MIVIKKNCWEELIYHPDYSINIANLKMTILKGVFTPDPAKTYSSSMILNNFPDVVGKKVLDVGSGTGLFAIKSLKEGCVQAVATDISSRAIENIKINVKQNNIKNINIIQTNLADNIDLKFDIIFANLPIEGKIWGLNQNNLMSKFFESISNNYKKNTKIYIPWGSFKETDREYIESIFKAHKWIYTTIKQHKLGHTWYLYILSRK